MELIVIFAVIFVVYSLGYSVGKEDAEDAHEQLNLRS